MTTIRYDTKYCPDAPYIYYHMLDDGYMVGGEYETLEEAATARADIIREHGEDKWEERMGKPDMATKAIKKISAGACDFDDQFEWPDVDECEALIKQLNS